MSIDRRTRTLAIVGYSYRKYEIITSIGIKSFCDVADNNQLAVRELEDLGYSVKPSSFE
jgi:hypothetical protein